MDDEISVPSFTRRKKKPLYGLLVRKRNYGLPVHSGLFSSFFDKVYGISFKKILELISNPALEEEKYFIGDEDSKNQNKWTVKVDYKEGEEVAFKIDMPEHQSIMRKLGRGRLLFHVKFQGGTAYLDVNNLREVLGINENEF